MPCQNGGTCTNTDTSYTCTCNEGWSGQDCSIKIPACQSMPCQNGGTCTNTDTSYTCTCNEGWSGQDCSNFDGVFKYEYALMIMLNHFYASTESSLIYMTTSTSATIEISTSNNLEPSLKTAIDQTLFFASELKVALPPEMQSISFQKELKAVKIRSTEPLSVVLFDNNYLQSNDGTLISPVKKLKTRYLVASSEPRFARHPVYASLFGVAALEDETLVTINFKLGNNSMPLTINGQNYSDSDTFEISLNNLETLQMEHSTDLSGTLVESSKPVAVFSGNRCNMFPESIRCSHFLEQMIPTADWGSSYIVPADFSSDGTLVSLMTDQSSTEPTTIRVGDSSQTINVLPRAPYQFSLKANESAFISGRVFVSSFAKGNINKPNAGSPYMVTIPNTVQSKSQYLIPIPEGYLTNYVTITTEGNIKSYLRLNGQAVEEGKIRFEYNDDVSILTLEVSPGMLDIMSTSGSKFGLVVFGYRYFDSYGFAANSVP
ncbi:IgGFc-binding protein-like isoform X2 [Saccostrea cucullata]